MENQQFTTLLDAIKSNSKAIESNKKDISDLKKFISNCLEKSSRDRSKLFEVLKTDIEKVN